jgi:hypothetical protein
MYCSRCGESLPAVPMPNEAAWRGVKKTNVESAGSQPGASTGGGWRSCDNAADVKYRWGSAWGGRRLLGTENIEVSVVNHGAKLGGVVLELRGLRRGGGKAVRLFQEIGDMPPGREVSFELASYELPDDVEDLVVSIVTSRTVE